MLNWSILLFVTILGIVGLWACSTILGKKNGLYFFTILAVVLSVYMWQALIYGGVSMAIIFIPLVFYALLVSNEQSGKQESKRLFYITLATMGVLFLFEFLQSAYIDIQFGGQFMLTWANLGTYISLAVGYVSAVVGTQYIMEKFTLGKMSKELERSITLSIASAIFAGLYVILTNIGVLTFGGILLMMLITFLIASVVSFAVVYFNKYVGKKPFIKVKKQTEKPAQEEIETVKEQKTKNENEPENEHETKENEKE